ncbi:hypothetical protein KI387_021287, partial [Taxus chinensis]
MPAHTSDFSASYYSDRHALLAFKDSLSLDPFNFLHDWTPHHTICNWTGVTCSSRIQRVASLNLTGMGLVGSISPFLGKLSFLEVLVLRNNGFHGHIPPQLGRLFRLKVLRLSGNKLEGSIPSTLGDCLSLQVLTLSNNSLSGTIPSQLGKLSELQDLFLWGNQLTGDIPSSLSNCTLLERLLLEINQLSGTVPLELGKLRNLRTLNLWKNHLVSGSSEFSVLTALTNCSSLEHIDFSINDLTGILPSSIGRLSSNLSFLSFGSNKFQGNIPSDIGNLTKLTFLGLYDNGFNGTIPSTLGQLPYLERLDLHKNNLGGTIPVSLGWVKTLGMLSLSENMLSGKIPDSLGDLPQLRKLLLDHNQLSGQIPASLGRCITLEVVDFSYNKLKGNIPPEFSSLQNLQFYFNISSNSLQGSLLQLSKMIMGPIPASLTSLKNLQDIDLSKNNLSGTIPIAYKDMKMLQHINLSSNRLTGEVPRGGVFATLDKSAVMGNQGLCGTWIKLQPCSNSKHKQNSVFKKVTVPVVIAIAVFSMSFLLLLYSYRRRHTSQTDPALSLNIGPTRISYEELVDATGGFNQTNLLGVGTFGSVYGGVLKTGINIAVKVLNLQDENACQSFNRECNVLKRVRHCNVMKIISTFSNLDLKALVLPFMSNGSLERWLYPQEADECRLTLRDHFRIAMEIAQGMAYLHHHCFEQVIHCDLKPSNVLLGDDMTAHIADFGISKLCFGNSMDSLTSTNALQGSTGYIAPEYGMGGKLSTKGDVYSYGILLLELLTRRKPTDEMFIEGINLPKWIAMDFPNKIIEKVDNSLLINVNEIEISIGLGCITQLLQVGLDCTRELPQQRPDMNEIVVQHSMEETLNLPVAIISTWKETSDIRTISSNTNSSCTTSMNRKS